MTRNTSKSSLLLVALLLPAFAAAAPAVRLLGVGDMSCSAWKATGSDPEAREHYVQWVRGFLSGHNYASPAKQVAEVSTGTVTVFIDRHCSEHSAESIADAAMRMSDRYSGRNAPASR